MANRGALLGGAVVVIAVAAVGYWYMNKPAAVQELTIESWRNDDADI